MILIFMLLSYWHNLRSDYRLICATMLWYDNLWLFVVLVMFCIAWSFVWKIFIYAIYRPNWNVFICDEADILSPVSVTASVRPSVRPALWAVTCRVLCRYTGHLSRTWSLVAPVRQVTALKCDVLIWNIKKNKKNILCDNFFQTRNSDRLSILNKTPSMTSCL